MHVLLSVCISRLFFLLLHAYPCTALFGQVCRQLQFHEYSPYKSLGKQGVPVHAYTMVVQGSVNCWHDLNKLGAFPRVGSKLPIASTTRDTIIQLGQEYDNAPEVVERVKPERVEPSTVWSLVQHVMRKLLKCIRTVSGEVLV